MRLVGTLAICAISLLCAAPSCGGGGSTDKPLDCAWLRSDNCWKTTVAAARPCVPPDAEHGKLSADGKTCTYDGGRAIAFPEPLLPVSQDRKWRFTVSNAGGTCLAYDGTNGAKLTTSAGTVNETSDGLSLTVTCPDGVRYTASNGFELFNCGADGGLSIFDMPGLSASGNDAGASVSLLGGADGGVPVFDCRN